MGNITENKINQILTAADIAAINTSIAAIDAKLPKGSLTDDQRANLKAINVDNKVFCRGRHYRNHCKRGRNYSNVYIGSEHSKRYYAV